MSREEITQAVKEGVAQALSEAGGCTAKGCGERCGITPVEHAESHKKINEFFESLADLSKTARGAVVKAVVGAVLIALAFGFGFNIEKFIK